MYKNPIFQFDLLTDTGVINIPESGIILINENSTSYIKISDNGLTTSSTLQDAIDNGNIEEILTNDKIKNLINLDQKLYFTGGF